MRKNIQGFCLSDITRVNDTIDSRLVEQLNNAAYVLEVIVGIADNADFHCYGAKTGHQAGKNRIMAVLVGSLT